MLHTFGERLRELREERDLKQKEVADALFISNKMLSSYERNISQPPIDMLIRICEYFRVSADSLLGIGGTAAEETAKYEGTPETQTLGGGVFCHLTRKTGVFSPITTVWMRRARRRSAGF
jgi:transcriptional regulator with XRE-family HTH domain